MAIRNITKQLGGSEDITKGIGTEEQTRNKQLVTITKLNASELQGTLVVDTIAEMEALVITDLGDTKTVIVSDNDRGGIFTYKVDVSLASNNGTIFTSTVIDSYWIRQYSGAVKVKWFGATGDGVTDDLVAIEKTRDFCETNNVVLEFTDGVYGLSGVLNLAIQDLNIIVNGDVTIKHLAGATGYVLDFDAGVANLYGIKMYGQIKVEAVSTSDGAFRVIACHHSEFDFRVLGSPLKSVQVNFSVLSKFRIVSSVNGGAFTLTPTTGLILDKRNAGEYVTDCVFDLTLEGINGAGLDLVDATGNIFTGTSEANIIGIRDTAVCSRNVFNSFWMEQNSTRDVELYGKGNTFNDCTTLSTSANIILVTAKSTRINNGYHRTVDCQVTSEDTLLTNVRTSDNASLGIKGLGTKKIINCVESDTDDVKTADIPDVVGESGSFTPTVEGITTAGTAAYITQVGRYTRVGKAVTFHIHLKVSSFTGAVGGYIINGLPFTPTSDIETSVSIGRFSNIKMAGGRSQLGGMVFAGLKFIRIFAHGYSAAGVSSPVVFQITDVSEVSSVHEITISGTYLLD